MSNTSEKKANHQLFFDLHSWLGISCGILLFVVCFSGVPAIFEHEISYWQFPEYDNINQTEPEALAQGYPLDLERTLAVAKDSGFEFDDFFIGPAHIEHPLHRVIHFGEDKITQRFIHPVSFEVMEHNGSEAGHVLAHLHTDLHLPRPYGRYLVGLSGMVLLIMLIAGVLLHKKWRREAINIRPKRTMRLQLVDHHKLIGLWTLPFTLVLTFTGTILGLFGIIAPILALAKFDGDVAKATEAVLGPKAVLSGEPAEHQPLNNFLIAHKEAQPESSIEFIQITGYSDKNAVIQFSGFHNSALSNIQTATFNLNNGELLHKADSTEQGIFQRLFAAVTPLHYVLFGDVALKFFYAISALALCLLVLTGIIMWLVRAGHSSSSWLSRLSLGACGGLVLATMGVFTAVPTWQHLLPGKEIFSSLEMAEEISFFALWGLGLILPWALKSLSLKNQIHVYLRASILLSILAIVLDALFNSSLLARHNIGLITPAFIVMMIMVLVYFDLRLGRIINREQKA